MRESGRSRPVHILDPLTFQTQSSAPKLSLARSFQPGFGLGNVVIAEDETGVSWPLPSQPRLLFLGELVNNQVVPTIWGGDGRGHDAGLVAACSIV